MVPAGDELIIGGSKRRSSSAFVQDVAPRGVIGSNDVFKVVLYILPALLQERSDNPRAEISGNAWVDDKLEVLRAKVRHG